MDARGDRAAPHASAAAYDCLGPEISDGNGEMIEGDDVDVEVTV